MLLMCQLMYSLDQLMWSLVTRSAYVVTGQWSLVQLMWSLFTSLAYVVTRSASMVTGSANVVTCH